jgi:SAM-dependent methyltransferase
MTVRLDELDTRIHPCPICQGTRFATLAGNDRNLLGITSTGCMQCGLAQTNPRPSAAGLDRFYRDHYRIYYQGAVAPDARYIADLNKDVRLAATAAFFAGDLALAADAVVLDFGCGEGSLFAALRKAGFSGAFYGVEPNAKFGEFASAHGNAIVSNAIRSREPVDLVTVNHVLEHLADPIGTLRQLGDLLKPEGRVYIDVPDAERYTGIVDLHIAHIFHFSERTLSRLVQQAGLVVVRVEKHRPPHHPASVRLVARRPQPGEALPPAVPTSPATEEVAWNAIRRSGRWRHALRLRLGRIGAARKVYHFAKGLVGQRGA